MRASARRRRITSRPEWNDRSRHVRASPSRSNSADSGWVPPRSHPRRAPAVDRAPHDEDDHRAKDGDQDALDIEPGDVGDAEHGAGDEATDDGPDDAQQD